MGFDVHDIDGENGERDILGVSKGKASLFTEREKMDSRGSEESFPIGLFLRQAI